jgi:hypothetical protein
VRTAVVLLDRLSGSGMDEHRCSARVRRAEPGVRREVDDQRRADTRAKRAARCAGAWLKCEARHMGVGWV